MAALIGLHAGAGCGNYSNEDLEYLTALPQTDDVSMQAPLKADVPRADEDEALKMTTNVTRVVNLTALELLALVDRIRSFTPTAREPNGRVWGPFPDDENPGWQLAFRMTKGTAADGVTPHFDYELVMIGPAGTNFGTGASPTPETPVLSGWFERAGRAGAGLGHLALTPKAARDAGAVLPNLEKVITYAFDYDNRSSPRTLDVTALNEKPADPTKDAESATYHYERAPNGDGGMTFTFLQDAVAGPAGVDTLQIASRWRGTGEGRARIAVLAGDQAGFAWVDCWAATSLTSYSGLTGVGDPSTCLPDL
ncbi:MAG TPA: hypothetical protein VIU64_07455 [Polyangia bacterium]